MNKKPLYILGLSLAMTLTSCGGGTTASYASYGDSKPDKPDSQPYSEPVSVSSRIDIPTDSTLYRALGLAENVEKLIDTQEVMGTREGGSKSKKEKRGEIPSIYHNEEDWTNPSSEYLDFDAFRVYNKEYWDFIDYRIEEAKELKNRLIATIYEFRTWVGTKEENFQLSYDKDTDTVYIKARFGDSAYGNINTRNDENGKAIINLDWYYDYQNMYRGGSWSSLHIQYHEDDRWIAEMDGHGSDGSVSRVVTDCDLALENTEVTELGVRNGVFTAVGLHTIYDDLKVTYSASKDYNSDTLTYNNFVYDKDGYNIITENGHDMYHTSAVSLWNCEGVDSIKYYTMDSTNPADYFNGKFKIAIGDKVFYSEEFQDIEGVPVEAFATVSGVTIEPCLGVYNDDPHEIKKVYDALGLKLKPTTWNRVMEVLDEKQNTISARRAYGTNGFISMTDQKAVAICDEYTSPVLSDFEVSQISTQSYKPYDEQVLSPERYESLTVMDRGEPTLDKENHKILLNGVSVALESSALLTPGTRYKAIAGLDTRNGFETLAESDIITYAGGELVLPFTDDEIDMESIYEDKIYHRLLTYVYVELESGFARITEAGSVNYSGEEYIYNVSEKESTTNYDTFVRSDTTKTRIIEIASDEGKLGTKKKIVVDVVETYIPEVKVSMPGFVIPTSEDSAFDLSGLTLTIFSSERFRNGHVYEYRIGVADGDKKVYFGGGQFGAPGEEGRQFALENVSVYPANLLMNGIEAGILVIEIIDRSANMKTISTGHIEDLMEFGEGFFLKCDEGKAYHIGQGANDVTVNLCDVS